MVESPSTTRAFTYTVPSSPPGPDAVHGPVEVPVPQPGAHDVVVEVHAAALNPVDIQLANFPLWSYLPSRLANIEKGVGCDFSGTVISAGTSVPPTYGAGTPLFGLHMPLPPSFQGTLREHLVMNPTADGSPYVVKPPELEHRKAAAIPLAFMTAHTALDGLPPNPNVAVLGASGGVGVFAVQIAKRLLNASRVVGSCSPAKAELVHRLGADEIVDYTKADERLVDQLAKNMPAKGWDIVLDCVGGTEVVRERGKLCSKEGKGFVSIVGDKTGRTQMGGSILLLTHPRIGLRQLASYLKLVPKYQLIYLTPHRRHLSPALELLSRGELEIPLDSEWDFTHEGVVKGAFTRLLEGHTTGKIVVKVKE